MVAPLRHRQTKGTATDMFYLTPPRHISTLPWPCENAKTLNRNRRSYSSKTVLVAQRASGFNLEIELKNIILRRVSIFEFLHSQGPECAPKRTFAHAFEFMGSRPSRADRR